MGIIYRKKGQPVKCKVTPLILLVTEPQKLENIPSLEWGKRNEANPVQKLMKIEGKKHENPKLLSSGLHISKSHSYIGATMIFLYEHAVKVNIVLNTNVHIL